MAFFGFRVSRGVVTSTFFEGVATALIRSKKEGVFGMSENGSVTAEAGEAQEAPEAKEFNAITSQEDLDRIIQARIERERKKIPTDYNELKAKADKFAEWEESQKTETQKQQEALAEAKAQLAELTVGKLRAEVAAAKGVPVTLLSGSTQEELEAAADALIDFRGEQKQAPSSSAISRANTSKSSPVSTADLFAESVKGFIN